MRIDPLTAGSALLVVGSALLSQLDGETAIRKDQAQIAEDATATIAIESDRVLAEAQLANERYLSGLCLRAANPIAPNQAIDPPPLPGSFICDSTGANAVTTHSGELTNIARTSDTAIIMEGLK